MPYKEKLVYKGPVFIKKIRDEVLVESWITQWGLASVMAHPATPGVDVSLIRTGGRKFFRVFFRKHKNYGFNVVYVWEPKLGIRDFSFGNLGELLDRKLGSITCKTISVERDRSIAEFNKSQLQFLSNLVRCAIIDKITNTFFEGKTTGCSTLETFLPHFVTPFLAKPGDAQSLFLCPKGKARTAFRFSETEEIVRRVFPKGTNRRLLRLFYNLITKPNRHPTAVIGHSQIAHDLSTRKGYGLDFAANYLQQVVENQAMVSEDCLAANGQVKGRFLKIFWKLIVPHYEVKTNVRLLMEMAHTYHIQDTFISLKQLVSLDKLSLMRFRRKPHWKQLHDDAAFAVTKANKEPCTFLYDGIEPYIHNFSCESFEFMLPQTNTELFLWGMDFGNCVGSYASGIVNGRHLIIGIRKNGKFSMIAQWNKRLTRIMHIEYPKAGFVSNETVRELEKIVNNDFRNALAKQGIR